MIQNKRDLGGICTTDGRVIRPGMLARSAQLSEACEEDLRGIATVIDLRTPAERDEAPDRACGREYLPLPVFEHLTAGICHESEADRGFPDMAVLYGSLMRECAASFRGILIAIMSHDYRRGAVLWHCTEGKDRCGMTTALVLEALGVDRQAILKDYLKTNGVNMPKALHIREQLKPVHGKAYADSVYQAYIADERYLRSAWNTMGNDYIHGVLKIGKADCARWRETILTHNPEF